MLRDQYGDAPPFLLLLISFINFSIPSSFQLTLSFSKLVSISAPQAWWEEGVLGGGAKGGLRRQHEQKVCEKV